MHCDSNRNQLASTTVWVLFASLSAMPALVRADSMCATNATDLQWALSIASSSVTDTTINLQAGMYSTSGAAFNYSSTTGAALIVQGGFNAGCTTQTFDASLSVLDGGHATQVLQLASTTGSIIVYNLTVQNGASSSNGGGIFLSSATAAETKPAINNVILKSNSTTAMGGGFYMTTGLLARTYLLNNLIVGNSATGGYGAGVLNRSGSGLTIMDNNTVTLNSTTAAGGAGGLYFSNSDGAYGDFENNILWNNGTASLTLAPSTNCSINDSVYDSLSGTSGASFSGNSTSDPKFVDAGGGNFHLLSGSPAFGRGLFHIAGYDLDSHVVSGRGRTDAGAYEDTIFFDDMDGDEIMF